jgi:hypothetical protein
MRAARDVQPHLRGHVIRGLGADHLQVAQQRRVEIPPQAPEGMLVTTTRGADHAIEVRPEHNGKP